MPMSVITGAAEYPADITDRLRAAGLDVEEMDALTIAEQAGSSKAVNLVLLGRLSRRFDFPVEDWLAAIEATVPARFLEMNRAAFLAGRGE